MSWYNSKWTNPKKMIDYVGGDVMGGWNTGPAGASGAAPGTPGSYTGGADANGYGGPGQIFGGDQVNLGALNLPYFQQDRDRLGGMLQGRSPYAGAEWGGLISQLQNQAAGRGPSVAQDAYAQASQNTTANLRSMANGSSSPAAARMAMMEQGRVGQGMAQGLASARTQEQLGAQSALGQALGARDQLNQNAYLDVLRNQLGLSNGQLRAAELNQGWKGQKSQQDIDRKKMAYGAVGTVLGGALKMGG